MDLPVKSVLFVTEDPIFPPTSGSAVECTNMVRLLRQAGAKITLLSFDASGSAWPDERKAETLRHVDEFMVIPANFPKPLRYLHLGLLFPWNFLFPNLMARTPAWSIWMKILHARAKNALNGRRFFLAFLNKITSLELIGQDTINDCCGITAIDIQDLHARHFAAAHAACARLPLWRIWKSPSRSAKVKMKLFSFMGRLENRFLDREIQDLRKLDRIVSWSAEEVAYLRSELQDREIYSGHYPIALPELSPQRSPTYDFGFLGSPAVLNLEGLTFFIRSVWPLIKRERPDATLLVAGGAGADFQAMYPEVALDGITIRPSAPHVTVIYDNVSVVVVPLLKGSGVSVKTIEAMSYGCAIVSTSVGVRGLGLAPGNALIGDTAEDFAALCLKLVGDQELRGRLSKTARATVEDHHAVGKQSMMIDALLQGKVSGTAQEELALD